jgi:hypothetical protein
MSSNLQSGVKTMRTVLSLIGCLLALQHGVAGATPPSTMSYQGVLELADGSPVADGDYDLTFRLYDASSGGTVLWTETQTLPVEDGIFNALLGAVTPLTLPFDISYWLGVQVENDPELTPRVALASAPYAFRAAYAETGPGGIGGSGTSGHLARFADPTTLDSSVLLQNGDNLEIPPNAPRDRAGSEKAPTPSRVNTPRLVVTGSEQAIFGMLDETDAAEDDRAAIYGYRTRDPSIPNPGTSVAYGQTNNAITGYNHWGDEYTFGVAGYSYNDYTRTAGVLGAEVFGTYWGALGYRDEASQAWGVYTPNNAYVGAHLHVAEQIHLLNDDFRAYEGTFGGANFELKNDAGTVTYKVIGHAFSGGSQLVLYRSTGERGLELTAAGQEIAVFDDTGTQKRVRLVGDDGTGNGRVTTDIVEITGGSDLSESFDVDARGGRLEPGMVVCIDPRRAGGLVVSDGPYARTVAGVLSGAGGIRPGMVMGQRGSVADGEHPVALTGRVWTWCDASSGPIVPGDLLTTAATPGHAMAVRDHARAQGAVLGKAMSSLDSGTGLVLVLVNLQ